MIELSIKNKWPGFVLPVSAIVALACALPAWAGDDHERARLLREAGKIVPLERIVADATRERPGTVLEIELEGEAEGFVYEIEILDDDGVVWGLFYDARTGDRIAEQIEPE